PPAAGAARTLTRYMRAGGNQAVRDVSTTLSTWRRRRTTRWARSASRWRSAPAGRWANGWHSSRRRGSTRSTGPGQATHKMALRSADDVDDQVLRLLRLAYEQNP